MPAAISPRISAVVIVLLNHRWPQRRIANSLGIGKTTVQRISQGMLGRPLSAAMRYHSGAKAMRRPAPVSQETDLAAKPQVVLGLRGKPRKRWLKIRKGKIAQGGQRPRSRVENAAKYEAKLLKTGGENTPQDAPGLSLIHI